MKIGKNQVKNSAIVCMKCKKTAEDILVHKVQSYKIYGNNKTFLICQLCIDELTNEEIMPKPKKIRKSYSRNEVLTPQEVYNLLSDKIIGQEIAKRDVSIAVANHLLRMNNANIKKSNLLIVGPTGTGKTEIARVISQKLNIPFVIIDATTLTQHGYSGEDVESILINLYQKSNENLEMTEKGIVFIDEIDKIAYNEQSGPVNSTSVQQALLKMIEGGHVKIPKSGLRKDVGNDMVTINTKNILFICAGAFEGMNEIDKSEKNFLIEKPFYNNEESELKFSEDSLINYGLLPEFIGRFSILTETKALTFEQFKQLLLDDEISLLNNYTEFLTQYSVDITFDDDFLNAVCIEAVDLKLGVRGLRKVLEKKLQKLLFEAPGSEYNSIHVSVDNIIKKNNFVNDNEDNFYDNSD